MTPRTKTQAEALEQIRKLLAVDVAPLGAALHAAHVKQFEAQEELNKLQAQATKIQAELAVLLEQYGKAKGHPAFDLNIKAGDVLWEVKTNGQWFKLEVL